MNILITGGARNLGSRLVVPLVQRGDRVVVFDTQSHPHFESREFGEAELIRGDLADRAAVLDAVQSHQIESIFHLGALLSASAEEHPYDAWLANINGMVNVLDAARIGGARRLIFSSTVATYGSHMATSLTDDAPQWPTSLYGGKNPGENTNRKRDGKGKLDAQLCWCISLRHLLITNITGYGTSATPIIVTRLPAMMNGPFCVHTRSGVSTTSGTRVPSAV
jgi:dTDP-4-dehydrorhamnose reductase